MAVWQQSGRKMRYFTSYRRARMDFERYLGTLAGSEELEHVFLVVWNTSLRVNV